VGAGDPDPAAARFQSGGTRLDAYLPDNQRFDPARLPIPLLGDSANLGDSAELIATDTGAETIKAGSTLPLALYWRALAPTDVSYTVFAQAIDEDGIKAGQLDLLPCGGGCPTTTWRPGDVVGQWYQLPISASAPPGRYQLIAGMYDLATGERLPWLDATAEGGNAAAGQIPLGWIEVEP
jgi:hypothetical protein